VSVYSEAEDGLVASQRSQFVNSYIQGCSKVS